METSKEEVQNVNTAVEALQKFNKQQKDDLLGDDRKIFLQLGFKKTPKLQSNFIKIQLPHSLHTQTTDICLFVKDLDKDNRDYSPTVEHFRDLLHQHKVSSVSEIIPLKGLKTEYQPFEAKKNLSNLYEVFLADDRIVRLLPSLLGKHFYGKKRYPVPLNLEAKDLKAAIKKALCVSQCVVGGRGNTCSVTVATTGQTTEAASENIQLATQTFAASIPGGWANIKSLHLKLTNSPALPIYLSLGSPNEVTLSEHKPKVVLDEPEEVTPVENGKVRVTPDGHIQIINEETKDFYTKGGVMRKKAKKLLAKQRKERLLQRGDKKGKKKRGLVGSEADEEEKGEVKESGQLPKGTKGGKRKASVKRGAEQNDTGQGGKVKVKKGVQQERQGEKLNIKKGVQQEGQGKKVKAEKGVQQESQGDKAKAKKEQDKSTKTRSPNVEDTKGKKGTRKRNVSEENSEQSKGQSEITGNSETVTVGKSSKRKSTGKSMERPVKKSRKLGAGKPSKKMLKK